MELLRNSSPKSDQEPLRVNLWDMDLGLEDRCAARRQYRTIRIALYAPQSYAGSGTLLQMVYGMERSRAKRFLYDFYSEVSWLDYLGSK